jgi:hypothetical protein
VGYEKQHAIDHGRTWTLRMLLMDTMSLSTENLGEYNKQCRHQSDNHQTYNGAGAALMLNPLRLLSPAASLNVYSDTTMRTRRTTLERALPLAEKSLAPSGTRMKVNPALDVMLSLAGEL